MSHLGELISAIIDGELSGVELDRANAHLAACARCRAEAADLRQLKRDLRALGEVAGADMLAGRLLAIAEPGDGGPGASRRLRGESGGRGRRMRAGGRRREVPRAAPSRARSARRRRGRYLLWSAVSLVVVGIGAAAFGMGTAGSDGPQITPQLQVFDIQHAITVGDVPFAEPADVPARMPEEAPAEPARP